MSYENVYANAGILTIVSFSQNEVSKLFLIGGFAQIKLV